MPTDWESALESRLRELLPLDLPAALPIYFVGRKELCARFDSPACIAAAYTKVYLDLELRPLLECMGRWKGRGFAAVFFEEHFQRLPASVIQPALINVAIHESAHFFEDAESGWRKDPGEWPPEMQSTFDELRFESAGNQGAAVIREADPLRAQMPRPFLHHEFAFIRSAIHATARAFIKGWGASGHLFPLGSSFGGEFYGLSDSGEYERALGDEISRMLEMPIIQILKTPAPARFMRLWKADLERLQKKWRRERVAANWCPEPFLKKES
jgi:hypothetical protein